MSLMRRRVMLRNESGGGGGLPSEYQQVEYIGISASGAYIATNYVPVQGDEIRFRCRITGNASAVLFSSGTGNYQTIVVFDRSNGRAHLKMFQTGGASSIAYWYTGVVDFTLKNPTSTLNAGGSDVTVSTPFQGALDGNQTNLWIFRRRNGGDGVASRLYSFSITNNGAEKLTLIPCYRKSDGEIGMYDFVSRTFYNNAGTGTFVKGADVN